MMSFLKRLRFDPLEVALVVGLVAVVTRALSVRPATPWFVDPQWEAAFVDRFGPEHYSSGLEEYMVRAFFNDDVKRQEKLTPARH